MFPSFPKNMGSDLNFTVITKKKNSYLKGNALFLV